MIEIAYQAEPTIVLPKILFRLHPAVWLAWYRAIPLRNCEAITLLRNDAVLHPVEVQRRRLPGAVVQQDVVLHQGVADDPVAGQVLVGVDLDAGPRLFSTRLPRTIGLSAELPM